MNRYSVTMRAQTKVNPDTCYAKGLELVRVAARQQREVRRLLKLGCAAALALFSLLPAYGETLVMGGTGAALGVMKRLADAYQAEYPETMVRVLPSMGTGGAIRATAKGKLDLGLGGRPIGKDERSYGLVAIPYARSPLVFVVSRDLSVSSITAEEIRAFYQGQEQRWPNGERCRPIVRPAGDSETLALKTQAPALSAAIDQILQTPGIQVTMTAQENVEMVGDTPGAFGYTTLTLLLSERRSLKVLAYNGVEPTLENLANGSYPFAKTLYMMTRPNPEPAVVQFVEFVQSRQGAEMLRRFGNLPIQRPIILP